VLVKCSDYFEKAGRKSIGADSIDLALSCRNTFSLPDARKIKINDASGKFDAMFLIMKIPDLAVFAFDQPIDLGLL
jgi:hypothetical protein